MPANTIRLHRVLRATPNGFTGKVHHQDAKVGGTYKMSFTNFSTDTFDDPNMPGEIQGTVTLKKVSVGTELTIVQEGVPEIIPPEACYIGWQESLVLLAKLVEAEVPD